MFFDTNSNYGIRSRLKSFIGTVELKIKRSNMAVTWWGEVEK
jgi:hypothetical protein